MNRVLMVCLLLQAVYATRNVSIVIEGPRENPAGVTYVEGNAPEELKAGPTKNATLHGDRVTHAALIHSSSRPIPKDDEIENEEFERFIKKHHNRPTIETVFVSSSPSALAEDEESEEYKEESSSLRSQAEVFKQPEKSQTFERHVALPSVAPIVHSNHGLTYTIANNEPHAAGVGLSGAGGIVFAGGDGTVLQGDGGQYTTFINGHSVPSYANQHFYQIVQPTLVPAPAAVPRTINVAQHGVKTKRFEIRRPAIQKHFYDIEERVIIRPAGSIVVELNRPVAKIPTGETVFALGGSQGGFGIQQSQGGSGVGIQQQQGAFGRSQGRFVGGSVQQQQGGFGGVGIQQQQGSVGVLQGGFSEGNIQQTEDGLSYFEVSQGDLSGSGIQQQQGAIGVLQGGFGGVGIQQQQGRAGVLLEGFDGLGIQQQQGGTEVSQGGFGGFGIQQQQGGVGVSQGGFGGVGIQQQQGGAGVSLGGLDSVGIQQQQGGIGVSQGVTSGVGIQQQQGGAGASQGGFGGVGIQQQQGGAGVTQGGFSGIGIQQQQGGASVYQGGFSGVGTQQQQGGAGVSQGGFGGVGIQQQQGGVGVSQGGFTGVGIQQQQGGAGVSQGGFGGVGNQQQQGGIGGGGVQQQQGGAGIAQGGFGGVGVQQQQGGASVSQGGFSGVGIQQQQGGAAVSQGGFGGVGIQQQQGGVGVSQGGFTGVGIQQQQGGAGVSQGGFGGVGNQQQQGGIGGGGIQQQQGGAGIAQGGFGGVGVQQQQGGYGGAGVQQSQAGISYSTTVAPTTPSFNFGVSQGGIQLQGSAGFLQGGFGGAGFQQQQGGIGGLGTLQQQGGVGVAQGGFGGAVVQQQQGGFGGVGIQQQQGGAGLTQGGLVGVGTQLSQGGISYSTTPAPSIVFGVSQGGLSGTGIQQQQGSIGISQGGYQGGIVGGGVQLSSGGITYSTTLAPSTSSVSIGVSPGGLTAAGIQQTQGGVSYSTTLAPQTSSVNIGAGIQQSQGGGIYSTTPSPLFTPSSPAPTVLIGGSQGVSAFQQSQGGLSGNGFQQSQGGIISSTTPAPFNVHTYPSKHPFSQNSQRAYYTTAPSFELNSEHNDDTVVVEARSKEISSSTSTTTERSFTSSVSEMPSANAEESSAESVQTVSKNITPYMITVGEPDFHYPPYVEISSNGSPLEKYQHQPYTQLKATSQAYPRMRYQGKLLTGEVQSESPAYVAEIPPSSSYEAQLHQHQLVGSSEQPAKVSQVPSSAHQQPAQVHQHHFVTTSTQPIQLVHQPRYLSAQQHDSEVNQASMYLQPPQVYQLHQESAQIQQKSRKPNLVAQIRHQQLAQKPTHFEGQDYQKETSHQTTAQIQGQTASARTNKQSQYSEQQRHPGFQEASTTYRPESYHSGERLYQQRALPAKYTQHHTINIVPSPQTILFNNHPQKQEVSERSQNLETPPEPEKNVEEVSSKGSNVESTTSATIISSAASSSPQTYASVLANSQPGILYATSTAPHHHSNQRSFVHFNALGSSLFAPNGRQVHLVYSQPPYIQHAHPESSHGEASLKQHDFTGTAPASEPQQFKSQFHSESQHNSAISSTTPISTNVNTNNHSHLGRGHQKYRNEQTHSAITLRSGRTYGDHRVIASTPAPSDGGVASESVQTRRIVVNHPFQTVQEVVEQEPITKFHQITVNQPVHDPQHVQQNGAAKQEPITAAPPVAVNELQQQAYHTSPQQDQQKASYRQAPAYKVAAAYNHPAASLSFHHRGSH